MRPKAIYLASPYSHPNPVVRSRRFKDVTMLAANILQACPDISLFVPITHSHPISEFLADTTNNCGFWLPIDFTFLDRCDELWLADMEGLAESTGVQREVEFAVKKGIPVRMAYDAIEQYRAKG